MEADVYLENQILLTTITDEIRDIFACGIRNPEKSCIFGIQLKESRNSTNDLTPDFEFYWQILESRTWNLESTARKPESKSVLDSLSWGDSGSRCEHSILWFVLSLLQFGLPCLSKASGRARESKASLVKVGWKWSNKQTKHVLKQKHTRVMGWWKRKEEKDVSLLSTSPQFIIFFFQLLQLQFSFAFLTYHGYIYLVLIIT